MRSPRRARWADDASAVARGPLAGTASGVPSAHRYPQPVVQGRACGHPDQGTLGGRPGPASSRGQGLGTPDRRGSADGSRPERGARPCLPGPPVHTVGINLDKGQQISLEKAGGGTLSVVRMGLGWQSAPRKGFLARMTAREIDLDASAVLFAGKDPVDVVFFQQLVSKDGSVRHTGDNRVGSAGQGGDDESILVDLSRVPVHVDQIVFTVNSFTGQTFTDVQNAFCRLIDETYGQELPATPSPAAAPTPPRSWPRSTDPGRDGTCPRSASRPAAAPSRTCCPPSPPTCNQHRRGERSGRPSGSSKRGQGDEERPDRQNNRRRATH